MAVLPESMDKLDAEDISVSFTILQNYIRYMGERIEFSMRNVTKNVSEAGISSAELYLLVKELRDSLAALQSTVGGLTGTVTSLQSHMAAAETDIDSLDGRVTGVADGLAALQNTVAGLAGSITSLQGSLSSLDERVTALESKQLQ